MSVKEEDNQIDVSSTEKTKTKIVVHINNYIFDNEEENTSNDLSAQLRSLASPDSFFLNDQGSHYGSHYGTHYGDLDLSRYKKVSQPKTNETYIVHAKSMKFPVKIRPSYEIYPSSNLSDKHEVWSGKSFNSKFDVNFQLPFISPSHQASFQNYQARHLQNLKPTSKVVIPNYLSTQYSMKPPSFTNRNSKSNPMLTYKKIIKLREANENIADKKENPSSAQKSNIPDIQNSRKNLITYGQNFERDQNEQTEETTVEKKSNENAHSQKNFRYIHRKKESPLIKPINYSFKLPPFLSAKYATTNRTYQEFSVNLINQEISTKNGNEVNRMTELSKEMDNEINKIIKNYPSIVVRRKAVKRF